MRTYPQQSPTPTETPADAWARVFLRPYGSRLRSGIRSLLVLSMLWLFGAMLPAAANECRLADPNSSGEHVGTICWFQFGAIDEDLPSGTSNVPFEFDLPDGSRVELNVSVSGGTAANPRLTVRQAPTWTGSNFSGNSGFYTIFTPNAAALHSPDGRGNNAVLTLSDIRLYAPDGLEVTDLPFEIVVADAERLNSNPEHLDFGVVSGGSPWNVLEWLGNAPASAVQQGTPATLDPGVTSACLASYVDCLRFKGMTSGSDANAVVLTSQKLVGSAQPFTVMGQIHSAAGQGFAVGVRCCAMRLRKVLPEGRANPADQFTYRIVNVNDQTVSTGTTSGTATGAYPYISTMAMSGNALTLIEEMAPGSVSTLDAYARRVVCVNTRTGQTVLDDEYDPAAPPTLNILEMGDVVDCDLINTPLPPQMSVVKSANPADGSEVQPGDTITYTLTTTVATSATTAAFELTDTLGAGLSFGAVTDSGAFTCSGGLVCTLPAGTLPGTYAVTYTATVDADATGTVGNSVAVTGDGGDPDPECTSCSTNHPVALPVISTVKSSDPPSGTEVRAGDVITYTLTVTVDNSATTEPLLLGDTLRAGQTLLVDSIDTPAGGSCGTRADGLDCTLPAGTLPGTYAFTYRAQVDPDAVGEIGNAVVPIGGGGSNPPLCADCETAHPLAEPLVSIAKTSAPGDGAEVSVGDTIDYTLTVTIENAAITTPVRLIDTPGAGLTVGALPAGCSGGSGGIICEVSAGTVPGTYTFSYPATVNPDAVGEVNNAVVSEYGGSNDPVCEPCGTSHRVLDEAQLRIVKSVGVRSARIGDIVRYTLTVENVGVVNVIDSIVVDTPPPGFSYVEGSMAVNDGDDAFVLSPGRHPLQIGGLDIAAGERATIVYMLRIGAGVRQGTQVNEAVARNPDGDPISNVATAQVTIDADPLLDDSLIFGTVFDDRDGDGWQDNAELTGVRVQGGFAPGAYLAGSTTLERGEVSAPVADASAPLLHGIAIGTIAARQSEADPAQAHQVVIRQRLAEAVFTGDFVLTSDQGVTLRMDAEGRTTIERDGDAAKGLTGAMPTVERRVAQGEGGLVVDYVIGNSGIDERGIPGVRIASVEGLLIETDQYGRYHLADVPGGERGYRNFILKVDPSTLPPGTVFTTDNPRVRRITPGIPVRFDFGVQLPVEVIEGGERLIEVELGEFTFSPDSAELREYFLPAIEQMAAKVREHGGGEVVITANGESEALAFERARSVQSALQARLDEASARNLSVSVRTEVDDPHSLVAGVVEGGALLGTVLFDTDSSAIRPEFEPLLDKVAAALEQMGGGRIAIVGHTDVRASHAYNAALGMRRARAVYEALASRLSPETRAKVQVESNSNPAAPVGVKRK